MMMIKNTASIIMKCIVMYCYFIDYITVLLPVSFAFKSFLRLSHYSDIQIIF